MAGKPPFDATTEIHDLIHTIPCGVAVTGTDGVLVFANKTLLTWAGRDALDPADPVRISDLLTRPGRMYYETHVAPMLMLQGFVREISCHLALPDGQRMAVVLNATVRRDADGAPERVDYTLFDARERSVYETQLRTARREAEELAAVVQTSANAIFRVDANDIVRSWNPGAERLTGIRTAEAVGRPVVDVMPVRDQIGWLDASRTVLAGNREHTFECQLPGGLDVLVSATEIGDRFTGPAGSDLSIVISNVTARKQAERRLELMVQEMKHRIKNSLGVISAVARQTIPAEHVTAFAARLNAMAKAQDLVTGAYWTEIDLSEVLAIAANEAGGAPAFVHEGPHVVLDASLATSFSLVFHELVTNAIKYGALSVPQGRITVRYRLEGDNSTLVLNWVESGGPEVRKPESSGFGSRMLGMVIAEQVGATVDMDFDPSGLRCHIVYPLGDRAA
ncbi:MAG: hypothetical protein CMF74_06445 [Maricaulis sp.]|nr:hypothetical protein [Maricaulis sp.]HAQ35220.1 hypothetical protein [Alphaproteobacteria bacterium]